MSEESATSAAPAAAAAGVPSTWEGAFGAYKYSKNAVKTNLGPVLTLLVIYILVGGALSVLVKNQVANNLLGLVVDAFLLSGAVFVWLAGVRGKRVEVGEAFSTGAKFFVKMLVLHILIGLTLFVSFLLLVVPFFFVLPRLALAYFFLVDKNMDPVEAFKASWEATKGNAMKVWGIIGAGFLMALLMVTIIGIPFSIYFLIMYSAAHAVLYEYLLKKQPVRAEVKPAAATAPA